ncbi:hypothetical protein QN379_07705 [Glaciimonas sp. Gout2]|uniref:hypothetical protein n=1 Tax=unclassified Glaciimonas TaxID=2644401 RepID=UPI002AB4971F|nr:MULTISPECIES: hypothetical protein [unclassified Glaciimonas]MDY7548989.1 hypothetical protein [Glaciimonas sp. CA11.2]MEB0013688.1 hypothetical protein [Glaciimonas sp. Cout2]MEB0081900.1 hypothetical protein [Glaciimonas sp. Gout2]
MTAQNISLSANDFNQVADTAAHPANDVAVKQSLLQKIFLLWIKPYENAGGFIPHI